MPGLRRAEALGGGMHRANGTAASSAYLTFTRVAAKVRKKPFPLIPRAESRPQAAAHHAKGMSPT